MTDGMHTAGLYLTLTLTRPYANFSSLLYFMAIALNRSFCFSTVHNLTLQTLDAISQNTMQRLSQNHANLFNSYRINPYPCFHGMLVADSGPLSVFKINK